MASHVKGKTLKCAVATKHEIRKISSGVPALDEMLHGGIPEGNSVLIAGDMGTGKTILTSQILYNGACHGERCLFVSLEQRAEDIMDQCQQFGWDIKSLVDSKMLLFSQHSELDYESLEISIENTLREYKDIKRVAIDPISMLQIYFKSDIGFRIGLFRLLQLLKKYGVTVFLVDDQTNQSSLIHVSDGVIYLTLHKIDQRRTRSLEIMKMRKTPHELEPVHFQITKNGIEIYPHERI
jgi:KaiC/GvpD/RAD55 family RecA-like ATPase